LTNHFIIITTTITMSTLDEQLLKAYEDGKLDEAKRLIQDGANVNYKDGCGWTPLHCASQYGSAEDMNFLVSKGADINAKTWSDWTPLHFTCRYGDTETVILLVSAGVDVHAKTNDGWTAILLACRYGSKETVSFLVSKGADVHASSSLIHKKASASVPPVFGSSEKNSDAWTPLLLASGFGSTETVSFLVDKGANVNAKPGDGDSTALYIAFYYGKFDAALVLLDHGADSSFKGIYGKAAETEQFMQKICEKMKTETAAHQEEMKSEKALSSDQVLKHVRENEQHKLEMIALQVEMKAEMTAFTVQEHVLVLENEQYKSKLAAIPNTRKKLHDQLSVIAVGIGICLLLVHFGFSSMKENEARQQVVSVECFILLFLWSPVVWMLLELKKATQSHMFSPGPQRFPQGHTALSACELQGLEAGEKQELVSPTEDAEV
jgi:ankyrin repeat protein